MTFYDLNFGADMHSANYSNNSSPDIIKKNYAAGISGRMQSSFAANFNRNKKFMVVDLLSAEVATGAINSSFSTSASSLWLSYRFEFGLGMIYRINKKNDVGLNFILLRFAHDNISQNISGSNVMLRYRYSKMMLEGGVETRRERIIGWYFNIQDNVPVQMSFGARYLLNEKNNIGVRCEFLSPKITTGTENFNTILSARIFYGIYF